MEKFIIWITPNNKQVQKNQFWTEAENVAEAIKIMEEEAKKHIASTFKVLGVSGFNATQIEENFKNNTFH